MTQRETKRMTEIGRKAKEMKKNRKTYNSDSIEFANKVTEQENKEMTKSKMGLQCTDWQVQRDKKKVDLDRYIHQGPSREMWIKQRHRCVSPRPHSHEVGGWWLNGRYPPIL